MRDPERLNSFYDELKELHKQYCPDLRFGQLMSNFFSMSDDPFYWEEEKFMGAFKDFLKDTGRYDEEKKFVYKDEDIVPAIVYIPKNCIGLNITASIYSNGNVSEAISTLDTEDVHNARAKGDEYEADNTYYRLTDKAKEELGL